MAEHRARCEACGADCPEGAPVCPACGLGRRAAGARRGTALLVIANAPDTAVAGSGGPTLHDIGATGEASKGMIPIDKPQIAIGRLPDNDVVLGHKTVSKYHARIVHEGDAFWVEDLDSTCGVRVNGQEVQRHRLEHGDRIKIGKFRLIFVIPGSGVPGES